MANYVLAITREARRQGSITDEDFQRTVRSVPGLRVPEQTSGSRVIVDYSGSPADLRVALGYGDKVHIERPILHGHC